MVRKKDDKSEADKITVTPPKMVVIQFKIRGDAPLVMNRFSQKAIEMMKAKQEAGSQGNKGRKKDPKDFQELYKGAIHFSNEGWIGIPAPAFRAAMISACRLVGFKMTVGKLSLFCLADGYDRVDGTPLVRLIKGEPRYHESVCRNETGVADIRPRALFDPGWEAFVSIRFDGDQFKSQEVANLMARVGVQVGLLEGRPDSPNSAGQGWGTFEIVND